MANIDKSVRKNRKNQVQELEPFLWWVDNDSVQTTVYMLIIVKDISD